MFFMKKKKVCIDISNIIPGKGGTGGGIATYAINLIKYLDRNLNEDSPTIYCLVNNEFSNLGDLKNIIVKNISVNNSNLFPRLFWLHVRLPIFCISKKIDVLHRIVPQLPGIKVCKYIITMHDFMFDFYLDRPSIRKYLTKKDLLKFWLFKKFNTMAVLASDGIIVPSETIKNELENKFHCKNTKVVMIYEASENFQIHKKENQNGKLNIGVVAGFYPHKGHFRVLQLARYFLELGFRDFKIFMRGSEVYKTYVEDIKKKITEYELDHFVIFEAFVSKITLAEIYSKFDLVLLLSEYEGFGLPVLEAQSYSVPVACSNIPIFKEVLQKSAFYLNLGFSKKDVAEFIKDIRSEERLKYKIEEGLKNVKRFSWYQMSHDTLALYTSLIKNKDQFI